MSRSDILSNSWRQWLALLSIKVIGIAERNKVTLDWSGPDDTSPRARFM